MKREIHAEDDIAGSPIHPLNKPRTMHIYGSLPVFDDRLMQAEMLLRAVVRVR